MGFMGGLGDLAALEALGDPYSRPICVMEEIYGRYVAN
jgi:hypothetical protein